MLSSVCTYQFLTGLDVHVQEAAVVLVQDALFQIHVRTARGSSLMTQDLV